MISHTLMNPGKVLEVAGDLHVVIRGSRPFPSDSFPPEDLEVSSWAGGRRRF